MKEEKFETTIGGWHAPCAPMDYKALAEAARRECQALLKRIGQLQRARPKTWDEELVLRRRIRMLTTIYYEQRGELQLFLRRAGLPPLSRRQRIEENLKR